VPRPVWEGLGASVWVARRRQRLSLPLLADITVTTVELLEQVEAGKCDPGRRVAQDLDRALGGGGEIWNAWACAHLASLFQHGPSGPPGRPPTITDALPEAYQVRAYAPLVLPGPYLTDAYAAAL